MKINKPILVLFLLSILISCSNSTKEILDSGFIEIKNGKNELVNIEISCEGCEILSHDLFLDAIENINKEVMKDLYQPDSYIPIRLHLDINKNKNLIWYDSNEPIKDVIAIKYDIDYRETNSDKNEILENKTFVLTYVDKVNKDLGEDILLEPLEWHENGYVNRSFILRNTNNKLLSFNAERDGSIYFVSSRKCIDTNSLITIYFQDGSNLELTGWDFSNCDAFMFKQKGFNKEQRNLLSKHKIDSISETINKETTTFIVPKNEQDYFQQYVMLK